MHAERIKKLQELLERKRVDAVLLTASGACTPNMLYYFDEETSPALGIITQDGATVFKDKKLRDWKSVEAALRKEKIGKIGLDDKASARLALRLRKFAPLDFSKELFGIRLIKDAGEIAKIRKAQDITKKIVADVGIGKLYGKTENHAAGLLELEARKHGTPLTAFPPIVLGGTRTREPHGEPTENRIAHDAPLLLDLGVKYGHYCGDYSVTGYEGKNKNVKDALEAVKQAQKAAVRKARDGVKGTEVNRTAFGVLKEYGFGPVSFRKKRLRLGHFIGLDVHDGLGGIEHATLRKGMAFTIEPGVYTEGFGVRFEDVVIL